MSEPDRLSVDNPIESAVEDELGRAPIAKELVDSIRELDASKGIVVGILGAWGHGKSSFVNLMRNQFALRPEYPVVDFNPWLFSGTSQLTDKFFHEVAAELRLKDESKFEAIANGFEKYGDVLSPLAMIPFFGSWFDRTMKALRAGLGAWKNRKMASRSIREEIVKSLQGLDRPIVVVIDDIDRLASDEIRDIFKLVRLTASFPNVIYILAFDRFRVEQALSENGVTGRAYLEKIVQLAFDLPAIPNEVIRSKVLSQLQLAIDGVDNLRFDQGLWPDIYVELVEPLIRNFRDTTRFALSIRPTIRALGSNIEVSDLLALEAFRVFRPELFRLLHDSRVQLTQIYRNGGSGTAEDKAIINRLIESAESSTVGEALVKLVFPAARVHTEGRTFGVGYESKWKREHRVAHIAYLDLYLSRVFPSELTVAQMAEHAYSRLADPNELNSFLSSLPPRQLEDVIAALEIYEDEFSRDSVVPASTVLLNWIPRIPKRETRGILDFMRPDIVVTRVVIRLLRRLETEIEREAAVGEIMSGLATWSSKEVLIRSVGHLADSGSKLISDSKATELESQLADQVNAERPQNPKEEWGLINVLWQAKSNLEGRALVFKAAPRTNPDEIRALLASAQSVATTQSFDSRSIRVEERLAWDPLVEIYGSEAELKEAISLLKATDGDTELVLLAERYAEGWRPKEF